ncbi:uncharacterized protein PgNI_02615, partial [Pyricularia grisea]|uniref:Uncharacterized protein n=1 Tax=Pyricularia grisea TaxID=148305 RepID=A0A6P8BLT8_PYRGI
ARVFSATFCSGQPFPRVGAKPQSDLRAWGGKLREATLHDDSGTCGADQASAIINNNLLLGLKFKLAFSFHLGLFCSIVLLKGREEN